MASYSTTLSPGDQRQHNAAAPGTRLVAGMPLVAWIYMICVLVPVEFSIGSVALTPLRILLLITIIPTSIGIFVGKYGKVLAVDYLFFLHMLWATLAVAINNPSRVVENVGSASVEFLGGYAIARATIRSPEQFRSMIKLMLILIVAMLPFSIVETMTGRAIIPGMIDKVPGLSTVLQINYPPRLGLYRVQNVFAHPIHYGLYCSFAFILVLMCLKDQMSLTRRVIACGIICFSVVLSVSSGAVLAVMLQVGLFAWAYIFRKFSRKWLLLLSLFALAYVTVDLLSNRSPMRVLMSYATFSSQTAFYRANIFDAGMNNVWANPIFGLGLRTWIRPAYMDKGSVDNFWLVMAMKYGIPGFLLIVVGYFSALVKIGRRDLSRFPKLAEMRLAWMITFCGLSFSLATVHVWTAIYSFVFFFFGAGLWMASYAEPEDSSEPENSRAGNETAGHALKYSRQHLPASGKKDAPGSAYARQTTGSIAQPENALPAGPRHPLYSRHPAKSKTAKKPDPKRPRKD